LDGNFVLYTASGAPVWASNTVKKDHSLVPGLAMQDDGNVVVYHSGMPVWATGTSVGDVAAAKIKRLHQRLGGTRGPLGNAVSGVGKEGGVYVRRFDAGEIRWAVDDGAKAYSEYYARILYKGLHCFGETGGLGSDEPYAIVSVYNPASREKVRTYKFGPYENVDGGSTRVEILQLWDDAASDIAVHTLVMEHDAGDHDAVRKAIQDALKKAADAAAAAFGVPTPPEWIDTLTLGVAEGITSIFGLGDDVVGQDAFLIRRGELVSLAQQPVVALKKFGPIEFNYPTDDADRPPISDGDASYKAYFEVVAGRREEPQLIVI
jgi:hypothetical protein